MKFDENTKLYICDRHKCGKNCTGECRYTTDVRYAKNPENYIKAGDLKADTSKEEN